MKLAQVIGSLLGLVAWWFVWAWICDRWFS
jgi:hypothetical protein